MLDRSSNLLQEKNKFANENIIKYIEIDLKLYIIIYIYQMCLWRACCFGVLSPTMTALTSLPN